MLVDLRTLKVVRQVAGQRGVSGKNNKCYFSDTKLLKTLSMNQLTLSHTDLSAQLSKPHSAI